MEVSIEGESPSSAVRFLQRRAVLTECANCQPCSFASSVQLDELDFRRHSPRKSSGGGSHVELFVFIFSRWFLRRDKQRGALKNREVAACAETAVDGRRSLSYQEEDALLPERQRTCAEDGALLCEFLIQVGIAGPVFEGRISECSMNGGLQMNTAAVEAVAAALGGPIASSRYINKEGSLSSSEVAPLTLVLCTSTKKEIFAPSRESAPQSLFFDSDNSTSAAISLSLFTSTSSLRVCVLSHLRLKKVSPFVAAQRIATGAIFQQQVLEKRLKKFQVSTCAAERLLVEQTERLEAAAGVAKRQRDLILKGAALLLKAKREKCRQLRRERDKALHALSASQLQRHRKNEAIQKISVRDDALFEEALRLVKVKREECRSPV